MNGPETPMYPLDWWERPAGARELDAAMAVGSVLSTWREQSMPREGARVGVVCDASTSMAGFSAVMGSLAWALTTGLHHDRSTWVRSVVIRAAEQVTRIGGIVPTLSSPQVCPWDRPVAEVAAQGKHARLDRGVELADDVVDLHSRGPARLLVLITGTQKSAFVTEGTCTLLDRLRRLGCAVLWVCPSTGVVVSTTFPGARLHVINPGDFAGTGSTLRSWTASYCLGSSVLDALTAGQDI